MYECECDHEVEVAEFGSVNMRVARKQYQCIECRAMIQPGDRHEHTSGYFDGHWFSFRTCASCVRIGKDLFAHCNWQAGEMWSTIHDLYCWDEDEEFCLCPG